MAAARLVRLTRGYRQGIDRLGVRGGTPVHRSIAATIRSLAGAAVLPEPGDLEGLIPPTLRAHVRRVPGTQLWLWYTETDEVVTLRALTAVRPP